MLGILRGKSHGRLARNELGEGLGHLRAAASHAASGVEASVRPKVRAVGDRVVPATERMRHTASSRLTATMAMVTPLAAASAQQTGSKAKRAKSKDMRMMQQKKKSGAKRRPMTTALLAFGAMAGIAAMAVRRRRQQQEWQEYLAPAAEVGTETDTLVVAGGVESAKPGDGMEQAKPAAGSESAKRAATPNGSSESVGTLSEQMSATIEPDQGVKSSAAKPTKPGDGVIGSSAGVSITPSGNNRH